MARTKLERKERSTIGNGTARASLTLAVVVAVVAGMLLLGAETVRAKPPGETPEEANAFLDRFVGQWIGEGTASGVPITETLACERMLDDVYLLMQVREIGGGNYQEDTYVGYRVEAKRYELYTFNNNTAFGSSLPFRAMTGRRTNETLVMEQAAAMMTEGCR